MSIFDFLAQPESLMVGDIAPTPEVVDQDGAAVDLAGVFARGMTLVYFYPKADTPGCTAQACSLRDSFSDLTAAGLQILGVSRDRPGSQKKFQEKYRLPFPLIADADGAIAKAFRVGSIPLVGWTRREAFLVRDGKIAWIQLRAATVGHADEVRRAVDMLRGK